MYTIESATAERVGILIECPADPTGSTPQFQVTSGSRSSPSGTWVNGSWDAGGWSVASSHVLALTPVMGSGQAVDIGQGDVVDLWIRYTDGTDTVVMRVGTWQGL